MSRRFFKTFQAKFKPYMVSGSDSKLNPRISVGSDRRVTGCYVLERGRVTDRHTGEELDYVTIQFHVGDVSFHRDDALDLPESNKEENKS